MRLVGYVLAGAMATASSLTLPAQQRGDDAELARTLASARTELAGLVVPPPAAFSTGDREIPAGSTVTGPIAVAGTLRVAGTIVGDAFAYGGDVVVLDGGHITGSAVAFDGRVRTNGGRVDGDSRAIGGAGVVVSKQVTARGTGDNLALTLGWASIALIVGIGVLVFGGQTLDAVGAAIHEQFGRSFITGIGATIAFAPALVLLVTALALTILGILLVPFAIVAFILAVTGLVALGFLASVTVTGHSLVRRRAGLSERGAALRALVVGIAFYFGLWLIAALLTPVPAAASVARVLAFAATWAAATVGLGATIITRAGRQAPQRRPAQADAISDHALVSLDPSVPAALPPEWQTPTPASGVVAARRPTSVKQ